jgi:hypothetical protein
VPRHAAKAFAAWSRKTLARLARHHGDGRTVRVVASNARDEAAVKRGWSWFRYLSKQLDPNAGWGSVAEPVRQLRAILKVWPYRIARQVSCAQMVGGRQDLWTKAHVQLVLSRSSFDAILGGFTTGASSTWRLRRLWGELGHALSI